VLLRLLSLNDFYCDILELSYRIFIAIIPVLAWRYICAALSHCKHDPFTTNLLKFQHTSLRATAYCERRSASDCATLGEQHIDEIPPRPSRRPESKCMMPGHEQNYFTFSEHRIFEPMIKQFRNLKGGYSLQAINRWNLLRNRLLCTASTSPRRLRQRLICASSPSIALLMAFAGHVELVKAWRRLRNRDVTVFAN